MKAVIANARMIQLVDRPVPEPGPGQLVLDVEAAGVGLVDLLMRQGHGGDDALVPGIEAVGTVTQAGAGADPALIGRRVFAMLPSGGYAEAVAVDAGAAIPVPDDLDGGAALAIGTNGLVAHFALERASIARAERVLVRGASGGIGVLVTQLAKQAGATVIASSRHPERSRLSDLGADAVVDESASGEDEFDVVIDLVAGGAVTNFIARLRPNGRYVLAGIAGGMPPQDFGRALVEGFRRSLSVATLSLDTIDRSRVREVAGQLFADAAQGRLVPVVADTLPLAEADHAHRRLSAGGLFGKLILRAQ